jgi:hypothetical protein
MINACLFVTTYSIGERPSLHEVHIIKSNLTSGPKTDDYRVIYISSHFLNTITNLRDFKTAGNFLNR